MAATKRILVIDDDASILSLCSTVLKAAGFEVHATSDVIDGYTRVQGGGFHVVILDLVMPVVTGYEFLRLVKPSGGQPLATRILILSGKSSRADILRAIQLGAHDFLVKPVVPELLVEKALKLCAE